MEKITLQQISVTELTDIIKEVIRAEITNQPKETPEDDTLTRQELKEFLGICDTTVWYYLKKGLPVYQVSRKQLFRKSEVMQFMKGKK